MLSLSKHGTACLIAAALCTLPAHADTDLAKYPIPPDYHEDRTGCYVPNRPTPAATAAPISALVALAPRAQPTTVVETLGEYTRASFSGQNEVSYYTLRAQYFVQQHDLPRAIADYRRAAEARPRLGAQPSYHDLVTRLPLSVLVYRAGRVAEAQHEWRTMLTNRLSNVKKHGDAPPKQPASVELLAQGRLDVVAARTNADWDRSYFETGAGQHVLRGLALAAQRQYDEAAVEWRAATACSPNLQAAHLMLGYLAVHRRQPETAQHEWIAALNADFHGPGDMYGMNSWHYDAIEALLRFTEPG